MIPSRELDALVAEKVMKLPGMLRSDFEIFYHKPISENKTLKMSIPFYSTDIVAAFDIVNRITKKGYPWEPFHRIFINPPDLETLPRQLCLAALKSVGVEV